MWVMANRKALPSVGDLAAATAGSEFALEIDNDWSWDQHMGWLPMKWRGEESGCEVELAELEAQDAVAAEEAGFPNLDCAIVISTRGWDSLQSGVVFGAVLATIVEGCISEDEDEYLPHTQAMEWARKSVKDADEYQQQEAEADKAKEVAKNAGDLEGQLVNALRSFAGQTAQFIQVMDSIGVGVPSGQRVSGSNWKLHSGDDCLDNTRYRSVRARQMDALNRWSKELSEEEWEAGNLTESQQKESEALEAALEKAGELDEKDAEAAVAAIESWPDDIKIEEVRWLPPHTVEVVFSGGDGKRVEFIVGGLLATVTVNVPPLSFDIAEEIRIL